MRKIKLMFVSVLAMAALASCKDSKETEQPFNEAVLSISVSDVASTTATIKVTETGNAAAPWYAFLTEDLTSDISTAVSNKVKSLSVNLSLVNTGNKDIQVSNLRPGGKTYRYIVTGLTPDGDIYGTPQEVSFTTTGDFASTAAWTVAVLDPALPTEVTIAGIENDYVTGLMTKEEWDATNIKDIINGTLDGKYTTESGDQVVTLPLDEPGDYVFYVFDIAANGDPTMNYAKLDIVLSDASFDYSGYEAYLGTWYFDGDPEAAVTVTELKKGKTYEITGLPGYVETSNSIYHAPVVADYVFETGEISISEQALFSWDNANYGTCLTVFTGYYVKDGKINRSYPFTVETPSVLATGSVGSDGNIVFKAGNSLENGAFYGLGYAWMIIEEGSDLYGAGNTTTRMTYPFSLNVDATREDAYLAYQAKSWYDANGTEYKFTEDKINKSLKLSGFGEDIIVDYQAGTLYFYASEKLGTTKDGYDLYFVGIDQDGFAETAAQNSVEEYLLATATISEDGKSIVFSGQSFEAEYRGSTYDQTIEGLQIVGYLQDDVKVIDGYDMMDLSIGLLDEAPDFSAYEAWLGTWYTSDAVEVTIAKDKLNKSYNISGLFAFPVVAPYDADNDTFDFMFTGEPAGTSGYGYDIYLAGLNQYGWVEFGDDNNILATAKKAADGKSINVSGSKFSYEDEGEIINAEIVGVRMLLYAGGWYSGDGTVDLSYTLKLPGVLSDTKPATESAAPAAAPSSKESFQLRKGVSMPAAKKTVNRDFTAPVFTSQADDSFSARIR